MGPTVCQHSVPHVPNIPGRGRRGWVRATGGQGLHSHPPYIGVPAEIQDGQSRQELIRCREMSGYQVVRDGFWEGPLGRVRAAEESPHRERGWRERRFREVGGSREGTPAGETVEAKG